MELNISIDMMNATPLTTHKYGGTTMDYLTYGGGSACTAGGARTGLDFGATAVPMGLKANTYLWIPTTNNTLANAPWGLNRYIGEQGFDVIEVNDSLSNSPYNFTSGAIPYAQNASDSYSIRVNQGLNVFLIPRSQLLNSSFGRGILADSTVPYSATGVTPPLLSGGIPGYTSPSLRNLSCYWQNRAVLNGSSANLCGATLEPGTLAGTEAALTALTDGNATAQNSGGFPANQIVENTSDEGAQVQSVFLLNVTSVSELDLLLAGILDNATGGVNGTLLPVTPQLSNLGLGPTVTGVIAGQYLTSQGLYGPPVSHAKPVAQPSNGLLNEVWNTVSGVVGAIVNGVLALATAAWNFGTATWNYITHAGAALVAYGVHRLFRGLSALESAGAWLEKQAARALDWLLQQVMNLLNEALRPIKAAIQQTGGTIVAAWNTSVADFNRLGSITLADASGMFAAISGNLWMLGMALSVVTIVAVNALAILTGGATAVTEDALLAALVGTVLAFAMPVASVIGPALVYPIQQEMPVVSGDGPWWGTSANMLSWYDTGFSTATSIQSVSSMKSLTNSYAGFTIIAFILAVIGLDLAAFSTLTGLHSADLAALIFAGISVTVDLIGQIAAQKYGGDWATKNTDAIVFGLDIGAFGISAANWLYP